MLRAIVGFRQDDAGDWVADLSCLHRQHVRHRPPFQDRAWVLADATRAERLGTDLDCPLCDRAEMPEGLEAVRVAGPFDEVTLPAALRRTHEVAASTWGCLCVLEGAVGFWMDTDPPINVRLVAGNRQPIPPRVLHRLVLDGAFRLAIEFHVRPAAPTIT